MEVTMAPGVTAQITVDQEADSEIRSGRNNIP